MLLSRVPDQYPALQSNYDRRRNGPNEKQAEFGAVQRATAEDHSKVRAFKIPTNSKAILTGAVRGNV